MFGCNSLDRYNKLISLKKIYNVLVIIWYNIMSLVGGNIIVSKSKILIID